MKRLLSITFCAALLLSVIVLAVSGANALPTKGYLLTDYGQQHWFLGNEATKAPDVTDGTVGAMEYGFAVKGLKVTDMVNETYPNDNWTKTNDANFSPAAAPEDTFDLYASYDSDNLYLAVVVHDSHWMDSMYHTEHGWLQGDEVYLDLGHYTGPEMVRTYQRIRFRMYSAGVDFYNASGGGTPYESVSRINHQATKDVDGRAFYAATTGNGELANMQGVITGYSFSSSVPVATGRGSAATVTYEISISKAAMQSLFANSDFMNETPGYFYFAPLMKVVGVAGDTVNRANYGIGWYSLDGNDTTKFTDAFWANFTSRNTKLPQVMFLGQKSEYKTLLGSYYEECTEHAYRGVLASTTEYKWVCTKCGYETEKKTLPTKAYLFSDFGQEYYFLGNEASYLPDVTDGKVSDREYTFVKKGIKVTDMINDTYGVWTKTNDANYNPAAAPEDTFDMYASYNGDMLYIAVVSHDNHWTSALYNETHGWLQSDDLYLNIGQNPGTTMTNTHSHMRFNLYSNGVEYMNESGDKVLYSSTSRLNHKATVNVQGGVYYLATEENGELGEELDGVIEAYSFSSDRATTEGQLGATLTYEIAIDLAAIRTKYNAGISTDKDYFYFAPRMKVVGVKSDTLNRSSYGLAYYSVDGSNTEIFTDEVKAKFTGWNTKLPHVMFFGESSEFSALLGDKYEACTSHSYRYILDSESQHKQICELCGYTPSTQGTDHTYDNGVVTTNPTNAKDGIMTYTCTACGITKTETIDKLGPTNPENMGKNSYKVMGSNILMASILEKGTPTTRFDDIMAAFESFDPDIFGLQECDALWHDVLDGENGFATLGYAQAVTGFGELNNPIYYKTDKFEVLDCGFTKYNINSGYNYTWALFEVIETGERFIVSCTHFTWMDYDKSVDTEEARELVAGLAALEAKYGVPVIAVGDYNSTMAEEAYTVMTEAYSSGRDHAAEKVNMEYRTMIQPGKAGNPPLTGTFVLDHIFYTKNKVIGEKYEVFIGPEAYAYSDHLPNMLTFKLLHEHSVESDFLSLNEKTHTGICDACKQVVTEAHNYVWTIVDENTCKGVCACGKTVEKEHAYDVYDMTESEHTIRCVCGKVLTTGAHKFDSGVITRLPSYVQAGEKVYTCEGCGAERKEEIAKLTVPESGYELEGFGQKHFDVEFKNTAPVADGVIGEDEYTLSIENMTHTADHTDDKSFIINSLGRVEEFNIYSAYGDDYIAVAAKVKVSSASDGDLVAFDLGFKSNTDAVMRYLIKYKSTGATVTYGFDGAASYVNSYTAAYSDGYITYELILDRSAVEEYAGQSAEKVYLRAIASAPVGSGTKELWFGFVGSSPLTSVHTAQFNRYPHVFELIAKDPEDIFDHKDKGQHHNYVGDKTEDAPKLDGNEFDKNKYKEVAGVDPKNVKGDEGFHIDNNINIGHFGIFMTYDEGKIYLAAEIDDKDFKGNESTTFIVRTIFGKMEITLAADGTLTDGKGVVCENGYKIFKTDNGEGGKIVVYALELDRAAVMLVNTMADGDADMFNLSVVNNDDSGTAAYTVEDESGEAIGHTFTLSEDPNNKSINSEDDICNITIGAQYIPIAADNVISVNISWTTPVFTFTAEQEWNDESFSNDVTGGVWSDDPATVTVINHSNQDISAAYSFATTVTNSGITGKFTSDESGETEVRSVTLESAATYKAATSSTVYFFVTDGILTDEYEDVGDIGNITITIGALGNN